MQSYWIWTSVLHWLAQPRAHFCFSASFTAPFTSQSEPEGLWLIDPSPSSRWSSWEDKTFATCTSYSSSRTMRTILLGVVWLCLGLTTDAWSLNGRRIETIDGEGTEAAIRGEKLLKRVRRGWMWNQFFLQEEYTGSDYQYIGKVRAVPLLPDFWLQWTFTESHVANKIPLISWKDTHQSCLFFFPNLQALILIYAQVNHSLPILPRTSVPASIMNYHWRWSLLHKCIKKNCVI